MTRPVITAAKSSATSPAKRRVAHSYDRDAGAVARELGVQLRMLCGVWGWPSETAKARPMTIDDANRSGMCKRCARSVERRIRERERGWR